MLVKQKPKKHDLLLGFWQSAKSRTILVERHDAADFARRIGLVLPKRCTGESIILRIMEKPSEMSDEGSLGLSHMR